MKKIKPFFLAAKSKKAQHTLKILSQKYHSHSLNEANVVVVLGGDGTILSLINDEVYLKKKIFGMNRGTIGFLMNNYQTDNLIHRISISKETRLNPVQMKVTDINNKTYNALSLNEVSLLRQNRFAANVRVKIDNKMKINKLVCDGILVSTPAGSTAYNLSAHGPILPLNSNLLALTPISAFRPRRWKGALLPRNAKVKISIMEKKKRPVSVVADNSEFRDIEYVEISEDKDIQLKMLFDPKTNLEERILNEQFIY